MKVRSPLVIAGAVAIALAGAARADEASDLKAKLQEMQQQMDQMKQQLETLQKKQEEQAKAAPAAPPAAKPEGAAADKWSAMEKLFDKIMKGFYGTIDVSGDYVTKGMGDKAAGMGFGWVQTGGNSQADVGKGHFTPNTAIKTTTVNPGTGETTIHPVGNVGWLPGISTNKSGIGYRGDHTLPWKDSKLIYQIEGNFSVSSSPGLSTSYTSQSNVTKAALGFGNTWLGVQTKEYGTFKAGTTYAPYKTSTDRMNPFSGTLGDYAVVMGNSGGDNRVEFGTRLEHALWYESPKMFGGFSFDFLVSPGQNRTYDAIVQSSGSPDCNGGNMPGSGNLPLGCDDGGFTSSWSLDLKYETKNLYLTAAYERHNDVNRNSDGIGSNNPIYGYYYALAAGPANPATGVSPDNGPNPLRLDMSPYLFSPANNTGILISCGNGSFSCNPLGAYTTDVGPETAAKFGAQYVFDFGLSVAGIYEILHRDIPSYLEFQNERSRNGYWFTATQPIGESMEFSFGYAHAGQTPGDPGGQHNFDPFAPTDSADMYTILFKQKIDKQVFWYVNAAETLNHGNVHYDLGAGGRGFPTDCHDGTHTPVIDYSSAGPTTWGGCKLKGVSVGIDYKF
ncbi:MAG: porin [Burkholderiaceae bacterium]|nr:porin [Burkholderiaceae bacterium]